MMDTAEILFEKKTKLKLGKAICHGDGTVYALRNHPDKLVKIVCAYNNKDLEKRMSIFRHLRRTKSNAVVKIHRMGTLIQPYSHHYYYIMDKLKPLKANNRNNIIACAIDVLECKCPIPSKINKKTKNFLKSAQKIKYFYADIHGGNIMRAKNGTLKFIDLESFIQGN